MVGGGGRMVGAVVLTRTAETGLELVRLVGFFAGFVMRCAPVRVRAAARPSGRGDGLRQRKGERGPVSVREVEDERRDGGHAVVVGVGVAVGSPLVADARPAQPQVLP